MTHKKCHRWLCADCKKYDNDMCDQAGPRPTDLCFVPTDEAKGRAEMEADAECDRMAGR